VKLENLIFHYSGKADFIKQLAYMFKLSILIFAALSLAAPLETNKQDSCLYSAIRGGYIAEGVGSEVRVAALHLLIHNRHVSQTLEKTVQEPALFSSKR
jgi:type II secretory pathway component PulF